MTARAKLADLILQLLTTAVREGELDPRTAASPTCGSSRRRGVGMTVRQLFGLVYVMERAALDELALDESFGATSEPWPSIAQMVRRASVRRPRGGSPNGSTREPDAVGASSIR